MYMEQSLAEILISLHVLWALWMIAGLFLALWGYKKPNLHKWRKFRIAHLIGILATATVPVWGGGICPLTRLEWSLTQVGAYDTSGGGESFILRWLHELLYWDVDPIWLSLLVASGAVTTLIIFILRPPRRS